MRKLRLGVTPVTLDAFVGASQGPVTVTIAPKQWRRLKAARGIVEGFAAGAAPIYGLNTGLGANLGHRLAPDEIEAFQAQFLAGRAVGVGDPLPETACRAAFLARIIGLAQGGGGVRQALLQRMIDMAAARLAPVIASRGSIGAGDLTLAAQMGAAIIGQGEIWVAGVRRPAAEALSAAGFAPITLEAKEGLALANSSSVTLALSGLAAAEQSRLVDLAMAVAALSAEAYGANLSIFDADLHAARPAAGQVDAAAWFRAAFEGASAHDAPRSIQDALSFRVLAPLFGSARAALATLVAEIETELNAAADNPLVLAERAAMLSTPNFHTPAIALALDAMAISNAHLAGAGAQRVVKLMTAPLSGLPKYLSPVGGASAGMVPMQKTAMALLGEVRLKAQPASLDAMPVSDMVEDVAPQTPLAARKLAEQQAPLDLLVALEAVVAAQAADLRAPARLGRAAALIKAAAREAAAPLSADRALGGDVDAARARLAEADVRTALGAIGARL